MILYKSFSGNSYVRFQLEAVEVSSNAINNTSVVNLKAKLVSISGGWANTTATCNGAVQINGVNYPFSVSGFNLVKGGVITLADKTVTVAHNTDGSKICSLGGTFSASIIGSATISGSLALTTLKRIDTFTASNFYWGDAISLSVTTNGLADNWEVMLSYGAQQFKKNYTAKPTSVDLTSQEWFNLASGNKSVMQDRILIRLTSLKGTSVIGYQDVWVTMLYRNILPVIPALTLGTHVKEGNANLTSMGLNNTFLQNLSNIIITAPTATFADASTFKANEFRVIHNNGQVRFDITNSNTFTNFMPSYASQHIVYVRVQDSRGRWSNWQSLIFTPLAYTKPNISLFKADRVNPDGTINIIGTLAKTTLSASVSSVLIGGTQKNTIRYKIDDITNNANKVALSTIVNTAIANKINQFGDYPIDSSATIRVTVIDAFNGTSTKDYIVTWSKVTMTRGTKGIGIGGIYKEDLPEGIALQCFDTAIFYKDVTINGGKALGITEQGGDYNNGYVRFTNGMQIVYKTINFDSSLTFPNALGTNYYSNLQDLGLWAVAFIDNNYNMTVIKKSSTVLTTVDFNQNTATSAGKCYIGRVGSSGAVTNISIQLRAEGRWK